MLNWTRLIELNNSGAEKISNSSGVYRLSYLDNSSNYIVYYTGQASNLKERINQHLLGNESNLCCVKKLRQYKCFFRVAEIASQDDRDGAEVALYNHYNPSCVERVPDVQPLSINFN